MSRRQLAELPNRLFAALMIFAMLSAWWSRVLWSWLVFALIISALTGLAQRAGTAARRSRAATTTKGQR